MKRNKTANGTCLFVCNKTLIRFRQIEPNKTLQQLFIALNIELPAKIMNKAYKLNKLMEVQKPCAPTKDMPITDCIQVYNICAQSV